MIQEIHLHNEKENLLHIESKFKPLFDLAVTAWQTASSFLGENETFGVGKTSILNWCMTAILAKQFRLFVATYRLAVKGLGLEAQLTCRAMFETFVNLKALSQSNDPDEYARLWMVWVFANNEKTGRYIVKHHPESQGKLEELQRKLADDKSKMGNEKWKKFVRFGPSLCPVSELCEKIGLGDAYSTFYPIASGTAHSYDIVSYARPLDTGQIETYGTPSADFVDSALSTAIVLLRDMIAHLDAQMGLNKKKIIDDLTQTVQAVNDLWKSINNES